MYNVNKQQPIKESQEASNALYSVFAFVLFMFVWITFPAQASAATTTISEATVYSLISIYPSDSATPTYSFNFVTDTGSDTLTAMTVSLTGGAEEAVKKIEITDSTGTTVYGSSTVSTNSAVSVSLSTYIVVSTTPTEYKVRITPKSHANMPTPLGKVYSFTTTVTDWVGTNTKSGFSTSTSPVAIDNLSPHVSQPTGPWTARSVPVSDWMSITYGNGLFVAVGTGVIMTSLDGVNWIERDDNQGYAVPWRAVSYGNGLYVAASDYGEIITSPDGITWTDRDSYAWDEWNSVAYGNGLFVVVSGWGNVVTSPDGITWTAHDPADWIIWNSVTYGNGLFVAVASNAVMTSPDGITWTSRTPAEANYWYSVTYANGLFVAVSEDGTHRVMTSPDGITWTARTAAAANAWDYITYGNGLFVAVACGYNSTYCNTTVGGNRVMTSPDGITWSAVTAAAANGWQSVTYGNEMFVAVSNNGTNRVMTSPGVELVTLAPGNAQVTASYTTPSDTDYHSMLVLMSISTAVVGTPTEGVTYTVGDTIGNATVVCIDTVGTPAASSTCLANNLTNETEYYFSVFARDQGGNYSLELFSDGSPSTPSAYVVTLDTGTVIPDITIYPGDAATTSSAFTFTADTGTTTVDTVTVFISSATTTGLALVEITSADGATVYGSTTNPILNPDTGEIIITLDTNTLVISTTTTEYRVRLTPKSHVDMPAPAGGTYTISSHIVSWTGAGRKFGSDLSATAVTIDNKSPTRGDDWTARPLPYNWWNDITYGNGLFVAVSDDVFTNRVMTSPDGITWTSRSASARTWNGVTYGNGLFVAVACGSATSCNSTNANRVMTSPDGTTWTARTTPGDTQQWSKVTYGNGLFVAVAYTGTGNRVMTSPDGTTWTSQTSAADYSWNDVVYANGLFVAVASSGTGNRVMTSPDGINWTLRTTPADNSWRSVTYGGGQFVAVAESGTGNRVITSPDGINWTLQVSAANYNWRSVTYGDGLFVAVANALSGVMVSANGSEWELRTVSEQMAWNGIAYGNGRFVAVAGGGYTTSGTNYAMTSIGHAYVTPGNTDVTVSYVTPPDTDYHSTVVLMSTSTVVADVPTEGVTYTVGDAIGGSTVVCVDSAGVAATSSSCVVGNLIHDTEYYFSIFTRDTVGNYSIELVPIGSPAIPSDYVVTLATGTIIPNTTIYPGDPATTSSAFTFTTDTGTTTVDIVTVSLGTATTGLALVEITSADGVTVYGSTTNPTGSSVTITLDMNTLVASTTPVEYRIRVTPKSHADMPVVPGGSYVLITKVTNWTGLGRKTKLDFSATQVTVDNEMSDFGPWVAHTDAEANSWQSVTYGNGLFVAVSYDGTNRVMTSPDSITWTARTAAEANSWQSVTYGNGLFVAVSSNGTNRVMTSIDGITWTTRTAAAANVWTSVTYGNGLFVAVSSNGTNRVMTSTDGITWTVRTAATASWQSVTYGNGLFVAVACGAYCGSSGDQTMISSDGITWTSHTSGYVWNPWTSVTYGNGLFVAVAESGSASDYVMTSPDGITWTPRSSSGLIWLQSVTYGNGLFVAVSSYGTNRVITSPDGINWTYYSAAGNNDNWTNVTYGSGLFVAVGTGPDRVMTSFGFVTLIPGNTQVTASYTTPPDTDYDSTLVLMSTSTPVVDVPTEGVTYNVGDTIGSSTVGCIDTAGVTATSSTCVVENLVNENEYYFLVFNRDQGGNYSLGSVPIGSPSILSPYSVTLATGTIIPNTTIYPGDPATTSSAFTFTTDTGTTTVDTVTVSLGTATTGLALVEITSADGATIYGSTTNPTTSSVTITLDMNTLVASTTPVEYRIRVTPKSHVDMPAPAGGEYILTTRVTNWTGIGKRVKSDFSATDVIVDNASPSDFTLTPFTESSGNEWVSVTYGNGLFVAVSYEGTNRVMTSPDGITWTARTAAEANFWQSVTYGNGLFVAVANSGTNRVMTSPDGITWTARTAAESNQWLSVTYSNGLFVAVAYDGTNRVMTSPDGITWTARTAAEANQWRSVIYGNGLFVAMAGSGTNRVMTSPDGITWTARTAAEANQWRSVTYGNNLFVAVSYDGTNRVMTSPDAITWTARTAAEANRWTSVTYGNGLFMATTWEQSGYDVMTSPDGINWTLRATPADSSWLDAVTFGNGRFVAVGYVKTLLSSFAIISATGTVATTTYRTVYESDYDSTIVLKSSSVITTAPIEGVTYNVNDTVGAATVVCVNDAGVAATTSTCVVNNLGGGSTHFAIFHRDIAGNYSVGVVPEGSPVVLASVSAQIELDNDYVFGVSQATTSMGTITITDAATSTIASTTDLRLTIATTTTDFRFNTQTTTLTFGGTASGKVSSTVSYEDAGATLVIDVTTDFAASDTLTINGIAVGSFAAVSTTTSNLSLYIGGSITGTADAVSTQTIIIIGSLLLSDHTLGQVSNQFSYQNKNDKALFAFNLEASGEDETITDLVLTLSGIQGLNTSNLTDFRLYKDNNSDRTLDGGDTQIDAAGIFTINGQNGAITFSSDFVATSSADYIVTGDTTGIGNGASVVFALPAIGVTAAGSVSLAAPNIVDTIETIQHNRHNSGAGGNSSAVGGAAPAGDGEVTGGGETGGGEVGIVPDGANIVPDVNFFKPTATGDIDNQWTNPANALLSDGTYATAANTNLKQSYNGFSFGIPGTDTIQGIAIKLDASGTTADGTIDIALSWDGGSSYTTAKATPTFTGTDIVYTVGGLADTWGRSWTASDFSSTNFRIRVTAQPSANTIQLDALEVRVYHQAGEGGAGGGGEI